MALFERDQMPHRSTLSRFLGDMDDACLTALRSLFVSSTFGWGWTPDSLGGLKDRGGQHYLVFDVDGTREAARQRAVPVSAALPPPRRRLQDVCGPGYKGRRRGEVVRTRTTVEQIHTHQWLGTFGGRGNGNYQGEFASACEAIATYMAYWHLATQQAIIRMDGQYGDGIILRRVVAQQMQVVVRWRTYALLDLPQIQAALLAVPNACITTLESQVTYELFDVPEVRLESDQVTVRVIVARHRWQGEPVSVGKRQGEWIYELFVTSLPPEGFHATDILDLYHGRGAFEGTLADEDVEGDPDRWCSYAACGQEAWQIIWQWVWNLRLALGQQFSGDVARLIEWAPAVASAQVEMTVPADEPYGEYGPLEWAQPRGGRFGPEAFTLREDGLLQCPAGTLLWHSETRQESATTQRLVYVAPDDACVPCALRTSCLNPHASGKRGRRLSARRRRPVESVATHTTSLGEAAILWKDVPGRGLRRTWMAHWRSQAVMITPLPQETPPSARPPRAERAHRRLSWQERLRRNARHPCPFTCIRVAGVPPRVTHLIHAGA